jgi:hypothetical protein
VRDRSLGEFESIFERASIPVLEIPEVPLKRVSVCLSAGMLDGSLLTLANYFKQRFDSEIMLHWSSAVEDDEAQAVASREMLQQAGGAFGSLNELIEQIVVAETELIIVASGEQGLEPENLDRLVSELGPPVLMVPCAIEDPQQTFRSALHSLTGSFQQRKNFAFSFRLVELGGRLLLLHTISDTEVDDVRESLRVAPRVSQEEAAELLLAMGHHGERYLKAIVSASSELDCDVTYRISLGNPVELVRSELECRPYGLLVVGCHRQGASHVAADVYQLMHTVTRVPVLAL